MYEATIERAIRFEGIGLHSGRSVCLFLDPAKGGGRVFVTGNGTEIPANIDAVDSAARATILGVEGDCVATVEHLLAALSMAGIDHARIRIDGPEVPAFDGSAAPILEWLVGAGLVPLGERRNPIILSRPIEIEDDDCSIRAVPAETFGIDYEIDFPQPAIGYERFNEDVVDASVFKAEIAPARTFGLMAEVEALRQAGLGQKLVLDHLGCRPQHPVPHIFRRTPQCLLRLRHHHQRFVCHIQCVVKDQNDPHHGECWQQVLLE